MGTTFGLPKVAITTLPSAPTIMSASSTVSASPACFALNV
jgi:hypothetical protein